MQLQIISGIYTDASADFRTSYPRNMVPVPKSNGVSTGYLRPADGLITFAIGPGIDRGGINWNGICYRVMGTKLCRVTALGAVVVVGDVGPGGDCTFDYSFDYLAVSSGGRLYYWNNIALQQVTDPDLGIVLDFIWIDGYFMTTDGVSLIVTELNDPFSVNPLKYGSSEIDPDPILGVLELRNEAHAINRYTIEVFQNIGGVGFPFQRIQGAQVPRGAIGTYAATVFLEAIAFVGSGRDEAPAIWMATSGQSTKISTREIDQILALFTEAQLSTTVVESRVYKGHEHLYIHLPDRTVVYDNAASATVGAPVWFILDSSLMGFSKYRARHLTWVYDRWLAGDTIANNVCVLDEVTSTQYDEVIGWDFGIPIIYNNSKGAIVNSLELVGTTGRTAFGVNPTIWTSYSLDGLTWSQEWPKAAGKAGQTQMRLQWRKQGKMANMRFQKFRGTSDSHISVARLEGELEPLYV